MGDGGVGWGCKGRGEDTSQFKSRQAVHVTGRCNLAASVCTVSDHVLFPGSLSGIAPRLYAFSPVTCCQDDLFVMHSVRAGDSQSVVLDFSPCRRGAETSSCKVKVLVGLYCCVSAVERLVHKIMFRVSPLFRRRTDRKHTNKLSSFFFLNYSKLEHFFFKSE